MKKLTRFTCLLTLGLSVLSSGVVAKAEIVDGQSTGEIEINGSIGKLDNTDPETTLPEGSNDWINVSLDTATLFHTTSASNHAEIESARYSIQNQSGRGVAVYVNEISGTPLYVESLTINPTAEKPLIEDPSSVNLITNGELTTGIQDTVWLKLANHDNQLEVGNNTQDFGNHVTFDYTGTTRNLPVDATTTSYQENYVMTLRFAAISADGTVIGQ